jgi:hypothetical protein
MLCRAEIEEVCGVAIIASGLKAAKTKVADQLHTMVSVHNSSLFDELREDVLQFAEEDDVVEEAAGSPFVNQLNMKANAAEYFASKNSPPKSLNSARSDRSLSSIVSQRHHNKLFFPEQRVGKNRSPGSAIKGARTESSTTEKDAHSLIARERRHSPRNSPQITKIPRDPSPISVRRTTPREYKPRTSPPKDWDTTKATHFSPPKIHRLHVPHPTTAITKEEKMFLAGRERMLKSELANKRRIAMQTHKEVETEKKIESRFQKHSRRVAARQELEDIQRNRRIAEKEKRAMENMESYFEQRNDKELNALVKQKFKGKQSSSATGSVSMRHNMHQIAKKKLAILEEDRLERLLRRVEEQDQRIAQLEKEKRAVRKKHTEARAQEARAQGYRQQWARRQRAGGLRSAGASIAGKRVSKHQIYPGRAPSALSTRSEKQQYHPRTQVPSRGAMSVVSATGFEQPSPNGRRSTLEDGAPSSRNSQWFEEGTETEEESGQDDHVSRSQADTDAYSSASAGSYQQSHNNEIYKAAQQQYQPPLSSQEQAGASEHNYDYYNDEHPGMDQHGLQPSMEAQYRQPLSQPQQTYPPKEQQRTSPTFGNSSMTPLSRPSSHQSVHSNPASQARARLHVQSVQRVTAKNWKKVPAPPPEPYKPSPAAQEPYGSLCWYYIDVSGVAQGPFTDHQMLGWHRGNFFTPDLRMRRGLNNPAFELLGNLFPNFDKAFESGEGPCPAVDVGHQNQPGFT